MVGTFAGNFPGLPVQRTINDMETVFQIENPNNNDVDVVSANVRAEGNKLIYTGVIEKRDEWDSVPDGYEGFDIENLKLVNYNIVDEMGYHSKEY